jgi:hypothetical protein
MSVDFAALTHAVVAGVADVRACLVLSRDGLALGAFPAAEEERTLSVWSQIATLGEVDRGFVGLTDEVWVFCRRGPYAAVATASPLAKPGLILDRLEQMLLTAEEARARRDSFRTMWERATPTPENPRGPRTTLHPTTREEPPSKSELPVEAGERPGADAGADEETSDAAPESRADAPAAVAEAEEAPTSVDTMSLRREFAGILRPPSGEDESS